MTDAALEEDDIQGHLFSSYAKLPAAEYNFFRLMETSQPGEEKRFATWLEALVDSGRIASASASRAKARENLALAFTASGLVKLLGLAYTPDNLPREFVEGMVQPHRSRLLGDVGINKPEHWVWGREGKAHEIDGVLIAFAADAEAARALAEGEVSEAHGMASVHRILGTTTSEPKEPFGFRDGISQPVIKGTRRDVQLAKSSPREARLQSVEAGEFVLGYRDGSGELPRSLSLSPSADRAGMLKPLTRMRRELRDFGRNGTFVVIRQLEQDVAGFHAWCQEAAARTGLSADEIAEKMVGRRKNGDAMALGATNNNDFDYSEDPRGMGCPVGAHVRRANPRTSVPASSPDDALAVTNRHRILRRGRGYEEDGRQGLVFVAMNASIARQFEFIQASWCNHPLFGGLQAETDPLSGQVMGPHGAPQDRFTIPGQPFGRVLTGLRQWVIVRGGGYFFLPGLSALKVLAQNAPTADLPVREFTDRNA